MHTNQIVDNLKHSLYISVIGIMAICIPSCDGGLATSMDRNVYDAGYLVYPDTSSLTHTFAGRNTLSVPVVVKALGASCSCTGSTIDKQRINPGEEFHVTMRVRLPGVTTESQVSLNLETNPQLPRNESIFIVKYKVNPAVELSPATLDFGSITPQDTNNRYHQVAHITIASQSDSSIASVVSISVPAELKIDEVDVSKPGYMTSGTYNNIPTLIRHAYGVELNRQAMLLRGRQTRTVEFRLSDGTSKVLAVSWNIESDITTSPSTVHFGLFSESKIDQSQTLVVLYRNSLATHFDKVELEGVDPSFVRFHASRRSAGETSDTFDMHLTLVNNPGKEFLRGTLRFFIKDNQDNCLVVPWSAFYTISGGN